MPQSPAWLTRAEQLGNNLWWTWHPEVAELFRECDPDGWAATNHNPIAMLRTADRDALARRVMALGLESRIDFQYHRLQEYLASDETWSATRSGPLQVAPVAYFSAEFGIHETLPLYSGGLGVLAGDFLKSASDLGVPTVGVGLLYANGYFHQRIDDEGWQREEYAATDLDMLPLVRAANDDGSTLSVSVQCGPDTVRVVVWLVHVGRSRLLLLDTDTPDNPPQLRQLTARLYGGDERMRLQQEIVLGIGGLRALAALGARPAVLHLNEGHSAFAVLERVRERMHEDGVPFDDALRDTAIQTVFTTHTPVAAGHDRFSPGLLEEQLGWMRAALGIDGRTFLSLGRLNPDNGAELFCMTVLALKGARRRNGVSSLHGHVARQMWRDVWPRRDEEEVPIGHITNGVHAASWLGPALKQLYDVALGRDWLGAQADVQIWKNVARIDDGELWETHERLRRDLTEFVRTRTGTLLDPLALTIGFARRFTGYKRATLPFTDLDRLAALCGDARQPLQFVFAGKAHPRDDDGKRLLQHIVCLSRDARFQGRLVVVPDYDINVARHLVQGVDVWLNTPLRPLEASGTSGQKALLNGVLNLSVLDGWWAEAYDGSNGFAIGTGATHRDGGRQWQRDVAALYDVLERQVVPLFYDRDAAGLPRGWIRRMKQSVMSLAWRFNADRMLIDYVSRCYLPAAGGLSVGGLT